MGLIRYPGGVASPKLGARSNDMCRHEPHHTAAVVIIFAAQQLLYASYAWYEVRRCVFGYSCTGRVNVAVVRSPAVVHQPTHIQALPCYTPPLASLRNLLRTYYLPWFVFYFSRSFFHVFLVFQFPFSSWICTWIEFPGWHAVWSLFRCES